MGRLVYVKDSMGKEELYTYDSHGRKLSYRVRKGEGTEEIIRSWRYDKNGNIRYATDGNGTTVERTYDEQGRIKTESITVFGVVKTTTYTYDNNGNLVSTKEEITDTAAGSESYGASVVGVDSEGLRVSKTVN